MALGDRRRMGDGYVQSEDINLVPIMNLFVVLIPFLLMSAAFFHISVINASVPALQKEKTDLAKSDVAVTMMVRNSPGRGRQGPPGLQRPLAGLQAAVPEKRNHLARSRCLHRVPGSDRCDGFRPLGGACPGGSDGALRYVSERGDYRNAVRQGERSKAKVNMPS